MAAPATRSPSEHLRQAVELSRRGDLAGAEVVCAELLARAPDDVEVNHFCGVLANRMGRFEVAAERLGRCVRADPARARAQAALGLACERSGRLQEAREAYAAAARAQPG